MVFAEIVIGQHANQVIKFKNETDSIDKNLAFIDSNKIKDIEIQLDIAEYNAITNRETYVIYIETFLASLLLTLIGVIATIWLTKIKEPYPNFKNILFWVLILSSQILAFALTSFQMDYKLMYRYIEENLRPEVLKISRSQFLKNDSIWGFESFLKLHRKFFLLQEMLPGIFCFVVFIIFVIIRIVYKRQHTWKVSDSLWLTINLFALIILIIFLLNAKI